MHVEAGRVVERDELVGADGGGHPGDLVARLDRVRHDGRHHLESRILGGVRGAFDRVVFLDDPRRVVRLAVPLGAADDAECVRHLHLRERRRLLDEVLLESSGDVAGVVLRGFISREEQFLVPPREPEGVDVDEELELDAECQRVEGRAAAGKGGHCGWISGFRLQSSLVIVVAMVSIPIVCSDDDPNGYSTISSARGALYRDGRSQQLVYLDFTTILWT